VIVKTEAIVLKTMKYGDTSKIVTLYSREYGRIAVIAKGARGAAQKFGSSLDSLNHVQVVMYRKEGRELHLLSQCDTIERFPRLSTDLACLGPALGVLELIAAIAHHEEGSASVFAAVSETLAAMNRPDADPDVLLLHFEMRLLDLLGFRPDFSSCPVCRTNVNDVRDGTNPGYFRLYPDGFRCSRCDSEGRGHTSVVHEVVSALQWLQETDVTQVFQGRGVRPAIRDNVRQAVWYYMTAHFEGLRKLNAATVFAPV
jgi:DNA repair protein RecO (recombination protein O)